MIKCKNNDTYEVLLEVCKDDVENMSEEMFEQLIEGKVQLIGLKARVLAMTPDDSFSYMIQNFKEEKEEN